MKEVKIKSKVYELPVFLPDATKAVTKGVDSLDLKSSGVKGVVVNTYHLLTNPGIEVLKKAGGIKKFMNYHGLVVSDSGGWQVFSLIHRSNKKGKITDAGVVFTLGVSKKEIFTPQKSLQAQFDIGSDIIICLDDFTPPNASKSEAKKTVERTVKWAKVSRMEYEKQLERRGISQKNRPLLLAVVQGGYFKDLRKRCAEELQQVGFDGYGYGGYVIDEAGNLDLSLSKYIAGLLPNDKIKFALGMGRPNDIAGLSEMGWDVFDCTLPTRDARHKRLYAFSKKPKNLKDMKNQKTYEYIYIDKGKYKDDQSPISKYCHCYVCSNFSRSYLRHLFKIGDTSAYRLATMHNLRFYTQVMELIKQLL